jgi:hypothetical protein
MVVPSSEAATIIDTAPSRQATRFDDPAGVATGSAPLRALRWAIRWCRSPVKATIR